MDITNRFFPEDNAPSGNAALLSRADQIQDPEDAVNATTGKGDVDRAAAFMRLLAAPVRRPSSPAAIAGERMFASLNCTACHTPALSTGPSAIGAIANKRVSLYSDLLLHDMGTLGDGIAQGTAARTRYIRLVPARQQQLIAFLRSL